MVRDEDADEYSRKWRYQNAVWNEDDNEYGIKRRCFWIQHKMKMQTNMVWNEDTNEYDIKWRC